MLLALAAPGTQSLHPQWFVGDWCFPEGHPLKMTDDVASDGDETITYRANGTWDALGESGIWRIVGDRLIETRTQAESWALGIGERIRTTTTTRITRHGRYAISMRGDRIGWSVKCPRSYPPESMLEPQYRKSRTQKRR
jgi:hypothetical protein